jgi:hypothetical protein
MSKFAFTFACLILAGCGTYTTPAAVKLDDGTALMGTTTAAVSGGHFQLATADKSLSCSGNYDALDLKPTISIPVTCSDGRYGTAVVTRNPDGLGGRGYVTTSDGKHGVVAFGNNAGDILIQQPSYAFNSPSTLSSSAYGTSSPSYSTRSYTGNCPTPDSLDAAGRRCGARSAASRSGGYDGYGGWAPTYRRSYSSFGGSTYVRGHYRKNGSYVRPHYRSSRRR